MSRLARFEKVLVSAVLLTLARQPLAAQGKSGPQQQSRVDLEPMPVVLALVPDSLYPGQSAVVVRRPGMRPQDVIVLKQGFTEIDVARMLRLLAGERRRSGDAAVVATVVRWKQPTSPQQANESVDGKVRAYARRLAEASPQQVDGIGMVPAITVMLAHGR